MKLVPWNPRRRRTVWLDADTGIGVDDDGRAVHTEARRRPSVRQVLDLAATCHAERVMLTGGRPRADWLLARAPGWTPGAHHLDHETPVGRFVHDAAQVTVEVRRAVEWFGVGDYTPADARQAWDALGSLLADAVPGAALLASPGATGRECWLRSIPHGQEPPPQVSDEVAELLRATSGQHRIERFPAPPGVTQAADVWLMDGRLMYAACVRELGGAPVTMLTGAQAAELLASPGGRYARARYQVRATVPDWWEAVGILPLAADDREDGWTYPSQPGRTFTTWCDGAELMLALDAGWPIEPLAGMSFSKARPLDTWAARLLRAHEASQQLQDARLAKMTRAGIRWMLLHSIGAWHSTGRTETTVTASPMQRPIGDGWGAPQAAKDSAIWRRRVPLDGRAALMAHPEWSTQVWGRARARVLEAPTPDGRRGIRAGALNTDPAHIISIYGDAVMTSVRPGWAADHLDDGKVGRIRVKGHTHGPVPWPTTGPERDQIMHAAERNGARCPDCQEG